jgi:uroporphyrinogen decarboxylase
VGSEVHVLQTIFSPLTVAKHLVGPRLLVDLRDNPAELHAGLTVVADTVARFAAASLESGADAVFFATQFACFNLLSEAEYREFGERYDRVVLDAVTDRADFVLLHAHGLNPMFDLLAAYPVQAMNWHDRRTWPTLAEGQRRFAGAVVGGIDEWATLQTTPQQVAAQAAEAIAQTGGRRFILTAGCVIPVDTPEANIRAMLRRD